MSETITVGNYNATLSSFIAGSTSLRQGAQDLMEFGFIQYGGNGKAEDDPDRVEGHGDAGYLSRFITACNTVKALPTNTLKNYIKAHTNLVYTKSSDDTMTFKKEVKGEATVLLERESVWWNWKGNEKNDAIADFNLTSQLKSLVTRLTSAENDNKTIKIDDLDGTMAVLQRHITVLRASEAAVALAAEPETPETVVA